jgi:hypothetical protein
VKRDFWWLKNRNFAAVLLEKKKKRILFSKRVVALLSANQSKPARSNR